MIFMSICLSRLVELSLAGPHQMHNKKSVLIGRAREFHKGNLRAFGTCRSVLKYSDYDIEPAYPSKIQRGEAVLIANFSVWVCRNQNPQRTGLVIAYGRASCIVTVSCRYSTVSSRSQKGLDYLNMASSRGSVEKFSFRVLASCSLEEVSILFKDAHPRQNDQV